MSKFARLYTSHGTGKIELEKLKEIGQNVIFEVGVLVFHPENICLGTNIYVGHYTILKGYYKNQMTIGDNTWIGQGCFLHSAGGLTIGCNVGIGPHVKIITSVHADEGISSPILFGALKEAPVIIENDCDIGVGTTILPGITIGHGSQIGAGSVVTKNVDPYSVMVGMPAKLLKKRV
ncbi:MULTISPECIES: acyltransferase [Cyanophyceae]|uniref:acyltransferase n=1 Tax=Cyanophyceae TaxID=3028117 RepID=UPI00168451F6|nr:MULTISPECIES: acyltransferase [Cyanophyceae]MBD1915650.1 transferase [Phormidium sp. FACHB-77]MBD2029284.1 transferase [Phormidium sp. FACHB-322]MBD2049274.1 transferase [Leptolyngbya sp. FACHB-60]